MRHGSWKRWAFAAVPAVGLLELGAHAVEIRTVAPESDWRAARDWVARQVRPEDLVAFAPRWADPIGREVFGPALATVAREGRPDETRFPRAFEVSVRGAHVPELASWRKARVQRFGRVTVTTWENPAPAHVIDDLVSLVSPERMRVQHRGADCPFAHLGPQSGGLGFGIGVPGDRFSCPAGAFVGVSVMPDLDYWPHRCIYAPPNGGSLRLKFLGVRFGRALHGHHGIYVEAERNRTGAPVTITFRVDGAELASFVHRDGDGWKPFELDTSALAGQTHDLEATIDSPGGDRRMYCFEADTR